MKREHDIIRVLNCTEHYKTIPSENKPNEKCTKWESDQSGLVLLRKDSGMVG